MRRSAILLHALAFTFAAMAASAETIRVASLAELAEAAALDNQHIVMEPGVYSMAEYLTDEVLAAIRERVPDGPGRPPVPMIEFRGHGNTLDLHGVVINIETHLYALLPRGYTRCLLFTGDGNTVRGLTTTNSGENTGSNGVILSVFGDGNLFEDVVLHVHGSHPWGYGDLLGKGGPSPVRLLKKSGFMVGGDNNTIRRCKVISRAFGHCFYIQGADGTRLEDCYAEGVMRSTTDMLADTEGPAFDLGFRSVYENRDGRFRIAPGYTKSLVEDGFRTYGNTGNSVLVNCIAVNTRAGFEIGGRDDGRTILDGCVSLGAERGFLIGGNTTVRRSRGDIAHGPLLYLRGGSGSDVDLEVVASRTTGTVHCIATIAGTGHTVRISTREPLYQPPALPILVGFGMPAHAEMATPILPAETSGIALSIEIPHLPTIVHGEARDIRIESAGPVLRDDDTRKGLEDRSTW